MSDHEENAPKPEPEQLNIKVKDSDVSGRASKRASEGARIVRATHKLMATALPLLTTN